ncbi:HNH endonuclease [Mycoplasmatota bacterium WC44]
MYELDHYLTKPLVGTHRSYKKQAYRALFLETNFRCGNPDCHVKINIDFEEENDISGKSNLQIAHIYGLKSFTEIGYNNYFHINTISDLNSYHNLIILCEECHSKYDETPTYDDYLKMLQIKSKINKDASIEDRIYSSLIFASSDIGNLKLKFEELLNSSFSYDATKFLKKIDINSINSMNRRKLLRSIKDEVVAVNNYFENYNPEFGKVVLSILGKLYLELVDIGTDKDDILLLLRDNEFRREMNIDDDIMLALVTYAVWKCEVLDKYDSTK